MGINPGKLRTYAILQALQETPDPYGQEIQSWVDLGPVMVWDRTPTARDLISGESLAQIRNHLIVARADPRIVPTCRFLIGDRVLRIVEVLPDDQWTWLYNVSCVEQRDEDPAGDELEDEG